MKGVKLDGLTWNAPKIIKKINNTRLMTVMTRFNLADSLIPNKRTNVQSTIIERAKGERLMNEFTW